LLAKQRILVGAPLVAMASASGGDWWKNAKSIYEFGAKDIDGNEVSLEKYKGYVLVVVNVACN